MFDLVYLVQKEGWRLKGAIIVTHTNPFNTQQEQIGMISPNKKITAITRARRSDTKDLTGGVKNINYQNNLKNNIPLIADLKVDQTFKDKAKKKGASIIDLMLLVLWLLREDI